MPYKWPITIIFGIARSQSVVVRVEWWFDGKHFSSLNRMKSNCTSYSSRGGNAIGFRQLLCATSFDTVELEIAINFFVYSQSVNASFK